MKDIRSSDLKRKLSQMRGQHIHTFEFQIFKNEANFREITIKCILKLLKENLCEKDTADIISKLKSKVDMCALYEFYSVVTLITEGSEEGISRLNIESTEEINEVLRNTDFLRQISEINEFSSLRQLLMTHEENNTIEGLPVIKPEVTIVLSFLSEEEIIVISD